MTTTASLSLPKLSKEFLLEIGGWRAMQEGKALLDSGKVLNWTYETPLLTGVVQSGTSTVNARLKFGTRLSDVENLCSCRQAREYGTVCPHVIALGLSALQSQNGNTTTNLPTTPTTRTNTTQEENTPTRKIKYFPVTHAPTGSKLLQLTILLPLDIPTAWKQNQIRIILEASIDGAPPTPLDAIPADPLYSVYEIDRRILKITENICNGEIPGLWNLTQDHYTDLFEALIGHERVMLGKKSTLKITRAQEPSQLLIDVHDNGDMHLHLDQKNNLPGEYLHAPSSAWRLTNGQLEFLRKLPSGYRLLRNQDVTLPRNAVGHFFQNELPQLEQHIQTQLSERAQKIQFTQQKPHIRIEIDGLLSGLSCKIQAVYGNTTHTFNDPTGKSDNTSNNWTPDPQNPLRYFVRDRQTEQTALRELLNTGFQRGQRNTELYTLSNENKVSSFLANTLPRWKTKWEIIFTPRLQIFFEKCIFLRPQINIQPSGQDWLNLTVEFTEPHTHTQLTHTQVQQLLQTGASHHRLPNGHIVLLPTESVQQFQEVLYDCQVQAQNNQWQINKRYAAYLHGVLQDGQWQINTTWQPPTTLQNYQDLTLTPTLQNTLRAYQKTGVSWLQYISQNSFGAILADEMGLGKTIQTLAWIDYRKKNNLTTRPTLIIGPTSLVQNWVAEAARFTPDLTLLPLHGTGRHTLFEQIPQHDLIITSYALLRRDITELQKHQFDTVVLDEAQNIKNRASQNAHSAKALNSTHRFVLTGTPMENSLLDLWSIFDFLMQGYLGPATEFRDRYETPITKNSDTQALARLQQRIRPFVLRRTKNEVARDLPQKIEQTAYCELTDDQKTVYQNILQQSRKEIFQHANSKTGKDRLAILTALTRLRQTCCHLHLLPGLNEKQWADPSAKMNYFLELLNEAIDGGHRILVFSQFVSLLKLIEQQIQKINIPYTYLDGSTTHRQEQIDKFQNDPTIPIFLISLKAGGTGLNLTGADTVIHFDPWWNPAVEDQATSRAHRMGQTKIVTSYKLIARNTVEEKIVQLQQRKKDLITSTIVSEEAFIRSLTWEELQGLLE